MTASTVTGTTGSPLAEAEPEAGRGRNQPVLKNSCKNIMRLVMLRGNIGCLFTNIGENWEVQL